MVNNNISDELLAAFLEGNVSKKELADVIQALEQDVELQEVFDIALQVDDEQPILQMAAEGGRNLCDIQCEVYVLQQLGIKAVEEDMLEVAKKNHWIRRAGTPLQHMGNLLEYKGLSITRKYNATIEELDSALKDGCGIIVAVDCDKLYPERPDEEDATNHAIVVTGMGAEVVTIFDPESSSEVCVALGLFMAAWRESRFYLVKTNNNVK